MSRVRVRAPELVGRGWLNTNGDPLSLSDLRGRVVVLDFWTFSVSYTHLTLPTNREV